MEPVEFGRLVGAITAGIAGKPLDAGLESELNAAYPPDSAAFRDVFAACRTAIAAGWMCNREAVGNSTPRQKKRCWNTLTFRKHDGGSWKRTIRKRPG